MRMRSEHRLEIEDRAEARIVRLLSSHYHADSLETLEKTFHEAAKEPPGGVIVLDLSRVVLFSSTALRALRSTSSRLGEAGGRIVAAGGGELVVGVLKFAPFVTHYATLDEALAALASLGAEAGRN